jgi:uncharacterized protein with FMN-binding domain
MILFLAACGTDGAGHGAAGANSPVLPTVQGATFNPGVYRATIDVPNIGGGTWRRAPMVVDVEFTADQIKDIKVVSHGESMYGNMYMFRAYPMTSDRILFEQSTLGVRVVRDGNTLPTGNTPIVFTGGTNTQEVITLAVEDAIRQAGGNPDSLTRQNHNRTTPLPGDRFVPGTHIVHIPADTYIYYNGNFYHKNDIPANLPAWPGTRGTPATTWNATGIGIALEEANRDPSLASDYSSSWIHGWRYGFSQGNLPRTNLAGNVVPNTNMIAPITAQRVLFHTAEFNRNVNANGNATAGPTWATTKNAGGVDFNAAAVRNLTRYFGTDQNIFHVHGEDVLTPTGLFVLVNFGRNVFQIQEAAGGDGLGVGGNNSTTTGESQSAPRAGVEGNYGSIAIQNKGMNGSSSSQALGGYWWIQMAHRTMNDEQSSHGVTLTKYSGSTQSAMGMRMALERAILAAGGNPANVTPKANPFFQEPNPSTPEALALIPGRYYIDVPRFPGSGDTNRMAVTLCRDVIRYIGSESVRNAGVVQGTRGTANQQVEGYEAFRDSVLLAFSKTFADGGRQLSALSLSNPDIGTLPGNEALAEAILAGLRQIVTENSYNNRPVNQSGRLGFETARATGNERLNNRYGFHR